MKSHRPKSKEPNPIRSRGEAVVSGARRIRFKLPVTEAHEVFIAGSFNAWHPAMFPMIESRSGGWYKDLLLPPGLHEYLFVADGRWMPDPGNPTSIPNPFGGVNSLLEIPNPSHPSTPPTV